MCARARFYANMSDRVYHNFLITWPIITKFGMQVTRLKSPIVGIFTKFNQQQQISVQRREKAVMVERQ
jgi:hypothetical protein